MKSALSCLILIFIGGSLAAGAPALLKFTKGGLTILEEFDLDLSIPYTNKDNKTNIVNVPFTNPTVVDSGCSVNATYAVFMVSFGNLGTDSVVQTFALNANGSTFSMVKLSVFITYDDKLFPKPSKAAETFDVLVEDETFLADVGSSYACDASVRINGTAGVALVFSEMQVQPFHVTGDKFSPADRCAADPTTTPAMTTTLTPPSNMTTTMAPPSNMTTTMAPPSNMTTVVTTMAPPPPPTEVRFVFADGNKTCILETIAATFYVNYTTTAKKVATFKVILPANATVDDMGSRCGDKSNGSDTAILSVTWDHGNSFVQQYGVDGTYFYLQKVTLLLNLSMAPDVKDPSKPYSFKSMMPDNNTFRTPLGNSLLCNSTQNTTFTKDKLVLSFADVKLQPYSVKSNHYSGKFVCTADNAISNIVPIIVGCALAVLVVIVLIAYLIGRRNSSQHGYESV